MTSGRALWGWVAVCVAGAGLVLLAAGRDWVTVTYGASRVPVSAAELAPALSPAAWAALAAVVAVLATGGVWRRVVGAVMALCGAGVVAAAVAGGRPGAGLALAAEHAPMTVKTTEATQAVVAQAATVAAWPVTAGVGGVLLFAGGVVAAVRGGGWPGMSGRYDRRGAKGAAGSAGRGVPAGRALWDAIDLGADPTVEPDGGTAGEGDGSPVAGRRAGDDPR